MLPVYSAHVTLLVLAGAVAMLTYLLAQRALSELLSRTVGVPGGVVFYQRAFVMLLVFGALGAGLSEHLDVKAGEPFMEYVWAVASAMGDVFGYIILTLAIYLVLMTVLVASLKPQNDK